MDGNANILITGTSTGIGQATALHLDRLGFRVFAGVRRLADGEALCAQSSGRLTPLLLDLTDPAAIAAARDEVSRAVGAAGLRGLVNNAGVAFLAPLEFTPLDDLRRLFEVNVFGLLAVTQAFLPLLRQAGGRIVNLSSEATIIVSPFHGPYTASKLALNGLTDALRRELRPLGVQVGLIIAGSIATPIWEKAAAQTGQMALKQPPEAGALYGPALQTTRQFMLEMGRKGIEPQRVAKVIAHALTARRPRHYYLVGPDAHLYRFLKLITPEPLADWVTLKVIGVL